MPGRTNSPGQRTFSCPCSLQQDNIPKPLTGRHSQSQIKIAAFIGQDRPEANPHNTLVLKSIDSLFEDIITKYGIVRIIVALDDRRGAMPIKGLLYCKMQGIAIEDGISFFEYMTGKIIRKLRLDEIPQLWNVLTGAMSLVGPRPERPVFVERLTFNLPYYSLRHAIKPGVTGWAQVCYPYGASQEDALRKLEYDLYYIKNMSITFDLLVIFRTIKIILSRQGSR